MGARAAKQHYSADTATLARRVTYDALDRERSVTTWDEDNKPVGTSTDYYGYKVVNTNGRGFTRTDLRNVLGQVEQVTDAKAGVTQFGYDAFGNLAMRGIDDLDPKLTIECRQPEGAA